MKRLVDEANGESWFKMPHALIDHAYPLLTGDAVKAHLVVTRWTHGLKNQRTTTSMTLGQVTEKCGFNPDTRDTRKAMKELKYLELQGMIKVHRENGKTNRIEILRPDYPTLKERVERLQKEVKPHTVECTGSQSKPHTLSCTAPHTLECTGLPETTHTFVHPSIDIDNIDTAAVEEEDAKARKLKQKNTEILMEIFESHMVHANKYQKSKTGKKRSADINAFWNMLILDRIEFNDIVEAIKYVYEGQGSWWTSKIVSAAAFRKNFATIHGQLSQNKQQQNGIVGLA